MRSSIPALMLAATTLSAASIAQTPKQPDTITTPSPNQPEEVKTPAVPVIPDEPGALWVPADPGNFQRANRPAEGVIDMVVVHDIEGSAEACLSWFQNPKARASSHYVVDSVTGKVYQMVKEHDIGWHAGNRDVNQRSVGIEHEGYAYRPGFYNAVEYEASARLIRNITKRYNIPRDRTHIIGHHEVPNPRRPGAFGGGSGHTDPGPYWDWDTLMTMVRNDARLVSRNIPATIRPGEILEATATFQNVGDDPWVANNSGREDASIVERGGATYLGTWNAAGRRSPFFNYKFWTSPTMASSVVSGDAAPGAEGRFQWSLLGPRTYGTFVEDFRVTRFPPVPKPPVAFGDTLTAVIKVVPWEIVAAVEGEGFTAEGWNVKQGLRWRRTGAGAPAQWTATLPISGEWDVFARWPASADRTQSATYEVVTADGPRRVTVNQRGRGEWRRLGRFRFTDPKAVTVRLLSQGGPGIVVAESVRFVGPHGS